MEETYSRAEVAQHNTEEDCWIILNGIVYDISDFVEDPSQHPGGIVLIEEYYGKDISVNNNLFHSLMQAVWANPDVHEHSAKALTQIQLYQIGKLSD